MRALDGLVAWSFTRSSCSDLLPSRILLQIVLLLTLMGASHATMAELPVAYPKQALAPLYSYDSEDAMFGSNIAIDGSTAVVGIPDGDPDAGRVALFSRDSSGYWKRTATLRGTSSAKTFGRSVAASTGRILVASQASIYLYAWDGSAWKNVQKVGLGYNAVVNQVRLSDGYAVVGAQEWQTGHRYVLVFGLSSGNVLKLIAKIIPTDITPDRFFVQDISVSGNTVVVGAVGAAYVYSCDTTSCRQQQKLIPNDDYNSSSFGYSVAVRGSLLLVGSPFFPWQNSSSDPTGSVYVYTAVNGTWAETNLIRPSVQDVGPYINFGEYLALGGDRLVVAAQANPRSNSTSSTNQFSYSYSGTTFTALQQLAGSAYPQAIALSGRTALSLDGPNEYARPLLRVYALK
jgi:FG-GAP repeat